VCVFLFSFFCFLGAHILVGKEIIVFRFIIEYSSSLRDFNRPLGNNNRSIFINMRIFER